MLRNFFALCLVAGLAFLGGRHFESAQVARQQLDAAIRIQDSIQQEAALSVAKSEQVDQRIAASSQRVRKAQSAVRERLSQPQEPTANDAHPSPDSSWQLDVGTVGLLNAARANTDPDTAGLGDAESQAPSGIGAEEFIDNDLEIVRLYHELAERHNALVDYVEEQMRKQAN